MSLYLGETKIPDVKVDGGVEAVTVTIKNYLQYDLTIYYTVKKSLESITILQGSSQLITADKFSIVDIGTPTSGSVMVVVSPQNAGQSLAYSVFIKADITIAITSNGGGLN